MWKCWLRWNGAVWQREETLQIEDLARTLCRREAANAKDKRLARSTGSEATSKSVERMTRSMRRHAASAVQFDADPWALNTPGGTVDLRSGQIRPHRREDFLTKSAAVTPAPGTCAGWKRVLEEATGGDRDLIAYLQRALGYALVGIIRDHVVIVLHGAAGGEGKSLIINTVCGVLGDYAAVAPADLLTPLQGERHSTDLAGLVGARLVIASEIEDGRFWAEAKLKAISGGDKIAARFMRGDFFTYAPQFTMIIATNHLPQLRSAGGMKRRLQIVPFLHQPAQPDPALFEKLRPEWPAILAWLIEGCMLWQRDGLRPPAAVVDATAEYFARENPVSSWLDQRTEKRPDARTATKALHRDFSSWAASQGERPLSERRFVQRLAEAGVRGRKIYDGGREFRGFEGIALCQATGELPLDAGSRAPRGEGGAVIGSADPSDLTRRLDAARQDPAEDWPRE